MTTRKDLFFLFLFFFLLLAAVINSLAQTNGGNVSSSSAVDVLYVQQNDSILTYNVNPQTGEATQVGQPLTLNALNNYIGLVPSPTDHFLNVLWFDSSSKKYLYVYDTDAFGVPQAKPVQRLSALYIAAFQADPNGKFDYALRLWQDKNGEYVSDIRLFTVDSSSGKLTESPVAQGRYAPNYYYTAGLFGFNGSGSKMYDTWNVNFDSEAASTYYYRTVDPNTGALGPDTKFFYWSDWQSADEVLLTDNLIIDLSRPDSLQQYQTVKVFRLINNGTPLINCTPTMLAACQTTGNIAVDPSGQYVFLTPSNVTQVTRIDLTTKQIVDTGNSIPGTPQLFFSQDGRLVFALTDNHNGTSTIQIYRFDKQTGALTAGNQISLSSVWGLTPAERR
jgi:hypothetical protein